MTINELIEKLKALYDFKSDDTYTSAVKDCIRLILEFKPELRLPVYRPTAPADWKDATCGMCGYWSPCTIKDQEYCRKYPNPASLCKPVDYYNLTDDAMACPDFHLRVPRGEGDARC